MAKALKILLLLITLLLGVLSLFVLIEESVAFVRNHMNFESNLISLLVPLMVFSLSIPSVLFHIKTYQFFRSGKSDVNVLDFDLSSAYSRVNSSNRVSNLLFILEFVLGVLFVFLGFIIIYLILTYPLVDSSILDLRYSVVLGNFALGLWIILDVWKLKKHSGFFSNNF